MTEPKNLTESSKLLEQLESLNKQVSLEQRDSSASVLHSKEIESKKKNTPPSDYIPIKNWAEEDRPREKLLMKGKEALSSAELIAILMGSGSRNESAVQLAKRILASVENDIDQLAKLGVEDLIKFNGVGEAKAISIIAAMELAGRRQVAAAKRKKITSSRDIFELLHHQLRDLNHEEFWVVYMNRANLVLEFEQVSIGGMTGTVADPKLIFNKALRKNACSIVVAHNHPSGNLKPSRADIDLTKKLKDAGQLLDLPLLDHLIVTTSGYYSFADEAMM